MLLNDVLFAEKNGMLIASFHGVSCKGLIVLIHLFVHQLIDNLFELFFYLTQSLLSINLATT